MKIAKENLCPQGGEEGRRKTNEQLFHTKIINSLVTQFNKILNILRDRGERQLFRQFVVEQLGLFDDSFERFYKQIIGQAVKILYD